jgi:hypothetical protein
MSATCASTVPEHKGLTVAFWSAAICFSTLLPITIAFCVLTKLLGGGDCLWVKTMIVLIAAVFGVPGIVLGAVTLLKLRRAASILASGLVSFAAIAIGAMSVAEGVYLSTTVLPSWQNKVDRMHG